VSGHLRNLPATVVSLILLKTVSFRTRCPDVTSSISDVTHVLYIGFMHTVNSLGIVSTTHPVCTAYSIIYLPQSM